MKVRVTDGYQVAHGNKLHTAENEPEFDINDTDGRRLISLGYASEVTDEPAPEPPDPSVPLTAVDGKAVPQDEADKQAEDEAEEPAPAKARKTAANKAQQSAADKAL